MKKIASLFLIITFIFVSAGCGNGEAKENNNDENKPDIDFNGQPFYFSPYLVDHYFPLEGITLTGDKMLGRYKQIEQDLNCVIEVVDMDQDRDIPSALIARFASGADIPDIIDRETRVSYPLFKSGDVMVPIEEIETIDIFDGRWGPEYLLNNSKFEGKFYGLFPYEWEFFPEFHGMVLTNHILLKQLGLANPYELQESKNWNWASFKEQLELATHTEGEDKFNGMSIWEAGSIVDDFLLTVAFSNGAEMITNVDGAMKFGLSSPQAIAAFDYAADLYANKLVIKSQEIDNFKNNQTAYHFTLSHMATGQGELMIANTMEDYGMLPFPNGPSAPEGNSSAFISYERRLYVLRSFENEPNDVGTVMNYMFSPLDDTGGWINTLKRHTVHHEEDYDNFLYMVENCKYNYMAQLDTAYSKMADTLKRILTGTDTAAEGISKIENLMNEQISKIDFE